jgi:hypothetical protein
MLFTVKKAITNWHNVNRLAGGKMQPALPGTERRRTTATDGHHAEGYDHEFR